MSCVQSNQVLTKFHNVCTKSLFCFQKKRIRKTHSTCQNKATVIKVFIFNKLDFQNCFLTFLTLKLCTNIKNLSKSQFSNYTISSKSSPLLETNRLVTRTLESCLLVTNVMDQTWRAALAVCM